MTEAWKPVPGFPGYDVSDHGRVRSYHKRVGTPEYWIIADEPQRFLSSARTPDGYLGVNFSKDSVSYFRRIHQIVMLAFVGPPPAGTEVCHNNGNRTDNRLTNLRYATHAANTQESCLHGNRLLNPEQVLAIREARANGATSISLATEYGVSRETISQVCLRRIYKLVDGPSTPQKYRRCRRKLSSLDVIAIRQRLAVNGSTQAALAREYGVSEALISRIKTGERRPDNSTVEPQ